MSGNGVDIAAVYQLLREVADRVIAQDTRFAAMAASLSGLRRGPSNRNSSDLDEPCLVLGTILTSELERRVPHRGSLHSAGRPISDRRSGCTRNVAAPLLTDPARNLPLLTLLQIEALAIVAGMLILFVSDRLRYDLVAAIALSAAVLTGVVPAKKAFEGFASPVIIIIASVLVISRAVAVSGVIDNAMRRLLRVLDSTTLQIAALTAAVSFMSAFVKNVGALGMFMPVAIQAAERRNRPPSRYLMPLAFGSLIGGTITQIGTSPNLLISTVRQEVMGQPYHLFDFTPVGLPLTCMAIAFLSVGWRLLPANRRGQASPEKRFAIEDYTSEALLPEESPLVGKTVADLEALAEGEVTVTGVIREHVAPLRAAAKLDTVRRRHPGSPGRPHRTAAGGRSGKAEAARCRGDRGAEACRTRTMCWRRPRRWSHRTRC